jgi:hypothetical protein
MTARPQARWLIPRGAAAFAKQKSLSGTKAMRRIYIVSAVVLLGATGAAGYYYYHMTCCTPPKVCCAPPPLEPPTSDRGK